MFNEFGELLMSDETETLPGDGTEEPIDPPVDPPIDPPMDPPVDPPIEEPEEDSEEIKTLKIRLREADYPLFSNEELQYFIDSNEGSLDMATYRAAILKSEANGLTLNGIEIESMSKFFLRIAAMYRPSNSGILRGI